jgi:hypothetical protein
MASSHVFSIFQAQSAALSYLFVRDDSGPHQLVAPSSQFVVGQSPPQTWQLTAGQEGLLSDPSVIPGGFSLPGQCSPQVAAGQITFACESASLQYQLTSQGLAINGMQSVSAPQSAWQIVLAFDSWQRFSPGWGSRFTRVQTENSLHLSYASGSALHLVASQTFQVDAFDATRLSMGAPENPNIDFPAGHYLPFPTLVVKFGQVENLHLRLELESLPPSGL